jgi:hypothetical protein
MNKILLALLIAFSGSTFAKADIGIDLLHTSASTNLLTGEKPDSQNKNSCANTCVSNFQSCYSDPWGPGWIVCEIFFERCMNKCGY